MKRSIFNIPNLFTSLRILLLPFLVYYINLHNTFMSLIFIIIITSTDFFDGFFARRFNQVTSFGAKFDTVADASFMVVSLLSLVNADYILFSLALIIISPKIISLVMIQNLNLYKYSAPLPAKLAAVFVYIALVLIVVEINILYIYYCIIISYIFSLWQWYNMIKNRKKYSS
ncbi:CDP-alcohol phosphatidyltransferase family protein [Candidatus Woesearchaeota archaeon]|nr:MAG: CDP-diacylglycerol-glycerol-3-phosphate 3-phosphatidyltransferase [archaeon GW2011_AR18]MBS3161124.1 CDP-alcohol phosphatidyltransferase family protein [Candidatus Woesearchaeota archaeon]HIH25534.1 hypothetical protein [Nanoarchaeota archaeon]